MAIEQQKRGKGRKKEKEKKNINVIIKEAKREKLTARRNVLAFAIRFATVKSKRTGNQFARWEARRNTVVPFRKFPSAFLRSFRSSFVHVTYFAKGTRAGGTFARPATKRIVVPRAYTVAGLVCRFSTEGTKDQRS